tara:strand:+ start:2021 stop:2356 length:336 start_codon:yes stop_codon:yes gene_type:complete
MGEARYQEAAVEVALAQASPHVLFVDPLHKFEENVEPLLALDIFSLEAVGFRTKQRASRYDNWLRVIFFSFSLSGQRNSPLQNGSVVGNQLPSPYILTKLIADKRLNHISV